MHCCVLRIENDGNATERHTRVADLAAAAWRRYLELTQDVDGALYREVEQIAWEELQESLARLPGQRAGVAFRALNELDQPGADILRPAPPSASGLGLRPFKAATRVRIPLGVCVYGLGSRPPGAATKYPAA